MRKVFRRSGNNNGDQCRTADNTNAVDTCNCHNSDIFTISSGWHRSDKTGNHGGEVICKDRSVKTWIFDQITTDNLTCYNLMSDMLGGNNQTRQAES